MKFSNVILAASAASMACAYPKGREVVPSKRDVELKKRSSGFTCEFSSREYVNRSIEKTD
jgi:endoglucanase